jgi:hypothetical protein
MIEVEDVDMEEDNDYGEEAEEEEDKDEELDEESDYDEDDKENAYKANAKINGDSFVYQPLTAQHLHNSHLYKRGPTKYQKASSDYLGSNSKGHWTKEEDLALAEAVKKN